MFEYLFCGRCATRNINEIDIRSFIARNYTKSSASFPDETVDDLLSVFRVYENFTLHQAFAYHSRQKITEMRGANFYFFELIKTVNFVIQCGFKIFELIKTVMWVNSLAGHFFEITDVVFFFWNRHHHTTANAPTPTLTQPTTQHIPTHTNTSTISSTETGPLHSKWREACIVKPESLFLA